jgi:hypothetical protein
LRIALYCLWGILPLIRLFFFLIEASDIAWVIADWALELMGHWLEGEGSLTPSAAAAQAEPAPQPAALFRSIDEGNRNIQIDFAGGSASNADMFLSISGSPRLCPQFASEFLACPC